MKTLYCFATVLACVFLTGCLGGGTDTTNNPPPAATGADVVPADVMRAGDKIIIRVTGVPDNVEPQEVQIPASGEVTMPLLVGSFHTIGRTTAELASDIRAAYKNEKIYTNPNVTVIPEERYVSVSGDVRNPSRVIYTPDLTLLGAISACNGFDEYADRRKVRILRSTGTTTIDAVKAQLNAGADPKLYPGDQIYVPRTAW